MNKVGPGTWLGVAILLDTQFRTSHLRILHFHELSLIREINKTEFDYWILHWTRTWYSTALTKLFRIIIRLTCWTVLWLSAYSWSQRLLSSFWNTAYFPSHLTGIWHHRTVWVKLNKLESLPRHHANYRCFMILALAENDTARFTVWIRLGCSSGSFCPLIEDSRTLIYVATIYTRHLRLMSSKSLIYSLSTFYIWHLHPISTWRKRYDKSGWVSPSSCHLKSSSTTREAHRTTYSRGRLRLGAYITLIELFALHSYTCRARWSDSYHFYEIHVQPYTILCQIYYINYSRQMCRKDLWLRFSTSLITSPLSQTIVLIAIPVHSYWPGKFRFISRNGTVIWCHKVGQVGLSRLSPRTFDRRRRWISSVIRSTGARRITDMDGWFKDSESLSDGTLRYICESHARSLNLSMTMEA